jgi:hypothetical protein
VNNFLIEKQSFRARHNLFVITIKLRNMATKYGKKSQKKVKRAMHEMKHGELKSGSSGKKVKSRKQAIAIGLSEARRSGAKVPKKSSRKSTRQRRAKSKSKSK